MAAQLPASSDGHGSKWLMNSYPLPAHMCRSRSIILPTKMLIFAGDGRND